jgi:hypothetical protein
MSSNEICVWICGPWIPLATYIVAMASIFLFLDNQLNYKPQWQFELLCAFDLIWTILYFVWRMQI